MLKYWAFCNVTFFRIKIIKVSVCFSDCYAYNLFLALLCLQTIFSSHVTLPFPCFASLKVMVNCQRKLLEIRQHVRRNEVVCICTNILPLNTDFKKISIFISKIRYVIVGKIMVKYAWFWCRLFTKKLK